MLSSCHAGSLWFEGSCEFPCAGRAEIVAAVAGHLAALPAGAQPPLARQLVPLIAMLPFAAERAGAFAKVLTHSYTASALAGRICSLLKGAYEPTGPRDPANISALLTFFRLDVTSHIHNLTCVTLFLQLKPEVTACALAAAGVGRDAGAGPAAAAGGAVGGAAAAECRPQGPAGGPLRHAHRRRHMCGCCMYALPWDVLC